MVDKIRLIALDPEVFAFINVGSTSFTNDGLRAIANTVNVTGNTWLTANFDSGKILYCSNANFNTVITLSTTAQTGVSISVVQGSTKNVRMIIQGTTGAANHKSSYANTSGQWGIASATVLENATGNTARWLLMGDMIT